MTVNQLCLLELRVIAIKDNVWLDSIEAFDFRIRNTSFYVVTIRIFAIFQCSLS
jgi:hypothetical protein